MKVEKIIVWRGECVRCRHIWWSRDKPRKCPKCGFTHGIMRDKFLLSKEEFEKFKRKWVVA